MGKTIVIIPSYNEEENIGGVLKALLNLTLPLDIPVVMLIKKKINERIHSNLCHERKNSGVSPTGCN